MKTLKLIILLMGISIFSTCYADTYYNGVPIYNIDYREFINQTPVYMPQSNYYNDRSYDTTNYSQSNSSNYIHQNNNSYDSGSIHFIYSSSQNPTYYIPGSSYSICH